MHSFSQLMIVPSTACPARCGYCFGPHDGRETMSPETIDAIISFMTLRPADGPLEITFHGGEPLTSGAAFFEYALPRLRARLWPRQVGLALQSNLWLLSDELCELFGAHGVSLGTSLDGPREITDRQRGQGYFERTMAGIERARQHGLEVGCICTFTPASLHSIDDIFAFFVREGLSFTVHAAVPSLQYGQVERFALTPEQHGELLVELLDRYLENTQRVKIGTLDALCRGVAGGFGGLCTFTDCLGHHLAVGPDGGVFPCQRFAALAAYRLGDVRSDGLDELSRTPVWQRLRARERALELECGSCPYFAFCKGGCPYNALSGRPGSQTLRDPHCAAYRRIFGAITERATSEVLSQENLDAVVERVDERRGLLRQGKLLALMDSGPHPYDRARHARRILAAVALASEGTPAAAARRLQGLDAAFESERTLAALERLHRLLAAPRDALNNLYLHLTLACNLCCTHCYADSGPERAEMLALEAVERAAGEAAQLGFRHAVLTGGEPLLHPQRDALLDGLARSRAGWKPMLTVLRTNLALPLDTALLRRVGRSTDEVVVSVDGDRETHDARRGRGSYAHTIANLQALVDSGPSCDVSLACVLPFGLVESAPGQSVRQLARTLGIERVRFRPLLPLGRAIEHAPEIIPETLWGHADPREIVAYGFQPAATCGIGQNLYVEPDGRAYPCYAWHGPKWCLGSIDEGLAAIVASGAFRNLRAHTVDSNERCRVCTLRYLCGGACRAWNNLGVRRQNDLDAPPRDCRGLHSRALALLTSALACLDIKPEQWQAAGLTLAEAPPVAAGGIGG